MTSLPLTANAGATAAPEWSARTARLYEAQWRKWEFWAAANGRDPAEISWLEEYLEALREKGASMSSIKQARAGVMAYYRERMDSFREQIDSLRQRPDGITKDGLEAIRATAHKPRPSGMGKQETPTSARARGRVDVALVAVMRDGMLRPSEALTITWADVRPERDGSGNVYIRRTRDPEGQELYLGPPTMQALDAIRPLHPDLRDFLFPFSPYQITRRIRAAAHAAHLQGHFSGDSPRLGMMQDLTAARGPVALFYGALAA